MFESLKDKNSPLRAQMRESGSFLGLYLDTGYLKYLVALIATAVFPLLLILGIYSTGTALLDGNIAEAKSGINLVLAGLICYMYSCWIGNDSGKIFSFLLVFLLLFYIGHFSPYFSQDESEETEISMPVYPQDGIQAR